MIFGDPKDFAIEVYRDKTSAGGVWGRMCIHVQDVCIGNIHEPLCAIYPAAQRFAQAFISIEELWDESFEGLEDAEIFSRLDRALYIGGEEEDAEDVDHWALYGRFNFLTHGGEQFDDAKTFIICRPGKRIHILYQRYADDSLGSVFCREDVFCEVIASFLQWFEVEETVILPDFVNPPKERDEKNDYWRLLEFRAKSAPVKTQRRIACAFCRLVWSELSDEGKDALLVAEAFAEGTVDVATLERRQTLLQSHPTVGQRTSSGAATGAVLWALEKSSDGYPAWYSAGIAASNVLDCNVTTEEELCRIIREFVDGEPTA